MTRSSTLPSEPTAASATPADVAAPAKGAARRGNLSVAIADALRQEITSGALEVGARLPSEAELTRRFDVSRTAVREAIAALRADGLVEPRQGAGVFVTRTQGRTESFFKSIDPKKLSAVIEVLELRSALEIEAAGLAAERRSPAQAEAILEAVDVIDGLIARGESTADADRVLHLTIADATSNPRFRELLEMFGANLIPRRALRETAEGLTPQEYLRQIQEEHRVIAGAIVERDAASAREAMRMHLLGSRDRYRAQTRRA